MKSKQRPIRESLQSMSHFKLDYLAKLDAKLSEDLELLDLIERRIGDRAVLSEVDRIEKMLSETEEESPPKALAENHFIACSRCGEVLPVSSFPRYRRYSNVCESCVSDSFGSKRCKNPRIKEWAKRSIHSHKCMGYSVKIAPEWLAELA